MTVSQIIGGTQIDNRIKKHHIYKNKCQEECCELENHIQENKVMYEE